MATWALCLLWFAATIAGLRILLKYESTPAELGAAPSRWPGASQIPRAAGSPKLIVIAHPHCPCTRATLGELALIMARLRNRVDATVVFIEPAGVATHWKDTDLWQTASEIPGVNVISDRGNVEADLFRANASGQTMLYAADGRLLFNGGITDGRGHSGENLGRAAIISWVTTGSAVESRASVYGCSLRDVQTLSEKGARAWNLQSTR